MAQLRLIVIVLVTAINLALFRRAETAVPQKCWNFVAKKFDKMMQDIPGLTQKQNYWLYANDSLKSANRTEKDNYWSHVHILLKRMQRRMKRMERR